MWLCVCMLCMYILYSYIHSIRRLEITYKQSTMCMYVTCPSSDRYTMDQMTIVARRIDTEALGGIRIYDE
jgi:hypothetical protein